MTDEQLKNKIREMILEPRYNSQKSFYKKAKVKEYEGGRVLQSYQTDVAQIVGGKPVVFGTYSPTTTRHIKEFLKQSGFKADTTKQIMKDYGGSRPSMPQDDSMLKTTLAIAKMGDIFGTTQKEKNDWKKRMLNAGLSNRGLSFPDDWSNLPEAEKTKRLNSAMGVFNEDTKLNKKIKKMTRL